MTGGIILAATVLLGQTAGQQGYYYYPQQQAGYSYPQQQQRGYYYYPQRTQQPTYYYPQQRQQPTYYYQQPQQQQTYYQPQQVAYSTPNATYQQTTYQTPTTYQQTTQATYYGDAWGFTAWLNGVRAQYGLPAVGYDGNLEAWASQNNAHQAARGLGHYVMGPARRQNSAMSGGLPSAMWMASPGHRSALLDPTIRNIGLAFNGNYWTFNAN